jgi:hypothetical protein
MALGCPNRGYDFRPYIFNFGAIWFGGKVGRSMIRGLIAHILVISGLCILERGLKRGHIV